MLTVRNLAQSHASDFGGIPGSTQPSIQCINPASIVRPCINENIAVKKCEEQARTYLQFELKNIRYDHEHNVKQVGISTLFYC